MSAEQQNFSNVEIDISDQLHNSLIASIGIEFQNWMHPCSYSIWEEGVESITSTEDLQQLVGECYVNDHIVELVINGIQISGVDVNELDLFDNPVCQFCGYELDQKNDKYSCLVCNAEGLD